MREALRRLGIPLLALAAAGCDARAPDVEPPEAVEASAPSTPVVERSFERTLVFMGEVGDTALVVPWLTTATTGPEGVTRSARAWVARGEVWEAFLDERWTGPPSRSPWRIVPHGPMRIVVGEDESLRRLIYSAAPRELELVPGAVTAEWTGRAGATFRLLEGSLILGGAATEGLVLDLSRTREGPIEGEESWAFLGSDDGLMVVLDGRGGNLHQGWARLDFRDLVLPEVRLEATELRPFDRARRDIPVAWTIDSPDGRISGTLTVAAPWLEAEEADGPRLPVHALHRVEGTFVVDGTEYAVRGLLRIVLP